MSGESNCWGAASAGASLGMIGGPIGALAGGAVAGVAATLFPETAGAILGTGRPQAG